jgi:ketosteroid isomerase-like protein
MTDREQVDRWLDAYIEAWMTYDPDKIGALFSDDVEYRFHPYDEPLRGRDAVVQGWLEDKDEAGTYEASYRTVAVDGATAVATGTSSYRRSPTDKAIDRVYENCYVMSFDEEGRCSSFVEWYMKRPD